MRVFRTILGMLLLTIGLPTLLGGGGLWAVMQHRDPGGAFSGELQRLTVPGYAVVIPDIDRLLRDDAPFARIGDTRIRLSAATVDGRAFLGLAPSDEVARYLTGVPHTQIDAIDIGTGLLPVTTSRVGGRRAPTGAPVQQPFWTTSGSGQISLTPAELTDRPYSLVLMNPGGAAVLRIAVVAEVRPGWLNSGTWGLLTLGTLLVMAGVIVLVWPGRRREVVYVVEPSQVPELMHAIGAPLPLPGGVAYFAGTRSGGAHRPRTLADMRPRPPALPQFAWPPNAPATRTAALPAGRPVTLSTATLDPTPAGTPTDDLFADDEDLPGPGYPESPGYPAGRAPAGPFTGPGVPPAGPATGSRPMPAGTTLTAPPASPMPGSPASGSPASESPASGSSASESPLTGSAVSGSPTTGSAVSGSPTTGSAVTGSPVAAAGSAIAGSPDAGRAATGSAGVATSGVGPAGAGTSGVDSVGAATTGVGSVGGRTPAPGKPLSMLGEPSALAGLQVGQVPTRRGDRRPPPPAEVPQFQATAVGAWVAATAPERARQTEARAAARLAEAARRNAGKFAPTQPGSRNMPTNVRIPIAPPRRDNGDVPAQTAAPATRNTPTEATKTSAAAPSSAEDDTKPTGKATGTEVRPTAPASSTAGEASTASASSSAGEPPTAPASSSAGEEPVRGGEAPTALAFRSPGEEPGRGGEAPIAPAPSSAGEEPVRGGEAPTAPAPSAGREPVRIGGLSVPVSATDKKTPIPVGMTVTDHSAGEEATATQSWTEPNATGPADDAEPSGTRIALHTGPAATDWTATGISRLGAAPAPRPMPHPTPRPAPAPSRSSAPAKVGTQAPQQKKSEVAGAPRTSSDRTVETAGAVSAGSPPEWPLRAPRAGGRPAEEAATGPGSVPAEQALAAEEATPVSARSDAVAPPKPGQTSATQEQALTEKDRPSSERASTATDAETHTTPTRRPSALLPTRPAPSTKEGDQTLKTEAGKRAATPGIEDCPVDVEAGGRPMNAGTGDEMADAGIGGQAVKAQAGGEVVKAEADITQTVDKAGITRTSIHTREASPAPERSVSTGKPSTSTSSEVINHPVTADRSTPAHGSAEQPVKSEPGDLRRSVHAVEAEGPAALPTKPSPVPTRGTATSARTSPAGNAGVPAEVKARSKVTEPPAGSLAGAATAASDRTPKPFAEVRTNTAGENPGGETSSPVAGAGSGSPEALTNGVTSTPTVDAARGSAVTAEKESAVGNGVVAGKGTAVGNGVVGGKESAVGNGVVAGKGTAVGNGVVGGKESAVGNGVVAGKESAAGNRAVAGKETAAGGKIAAERHGSTGVKGTAAVGTGKADGTSRPRKAAGGRSSGDDLLARAQERADGKAVAARPAPAARRAPAAWIKAAESVAARAGRAGGGTAPRVPEEGATTANPAETADGPANRPLSYREEAAELLAAAGGGERRRRRTVAGRNRPKGEPPTGPTTDSQADGNTLPASPQGGKPSPQAGEETRPPGVTTGPQAAANGGRQGERGVPEVGGKAGPQDGKAGPQDGKAAPQDSPQGGTGVAQAAEPTAP
ncbi:hypothetical protein [Actinoplanes xinjiangensis]|uniref:hypothetical protein n=1 Tax=Actinoplanes xinjiangensis TaxID=512350 RepID=UPI00342E04E5